MNQNDTTSYIEQFKSIVEGLAPIVVAVLVYMGVRYQFRKKTKSKEELAREVEAEQAKTQRSIRNQAAQERLLHSKIAKEIQNSANRLRAIGGLNRAVEEIFNESTSERFLILIAINGKLFYKTISVIYQLPTPVNYGYNAVKRYASIDVDDSYRNMLKEAEHYGGVMVTTSEIQNTLLGNIYKDEEIFESKVYFVHREFLGEGKDVLVYVSLATKDGKGFTKSDEQKMDMIVSSRIIGYVKQIVKNT